MAQMHNESLKMAYPKMRNDKGVSDYLISKTEIKSIVRDYEWDKARQGPQMKLVEVRKDLDRCERALIDKKRQEKEKRRQLKDQWKNLEEKEQQFRDNFIHFNDFVKSNCEKRERAILRTKEEKALTIKRTEDLHNLKEKFEQMTDVKELLRQKVSDYQIYERFLQSVVETSKQFKDVVDLVNRYEALMMAKRQLAKRQQEELEELEMARNNMMQLIEDNTFLILGLNNKIAFLRKRYTGASSRSRHWETVVNAIRTRIFEKCEEIREVRLSAWNIYRFMCTRKMEKVEFGKDDFENHLVYIKKTLLELKRVNFAARVQKNRKVGSNDAVKSLVSTNQLFSSF